MVEGATVNSITVIATSSSLAVALEEMEICTPSSSHFLSKESGKRFDCCYYGYCCHLIVLLLRPYMNTILRLYIN